MFRTSPRQLEFTKYSICYTKSFKNVVTLLFLAQSVLNTVTEKQNQTAQ